MSTLADFYCAPGPFTEPTVYRDRLLAVPDDDAAAIAFIKRLLIHPLTARENEVRFDYRKALRSQIDVRSIDDILNHPKVRALLELDSAGSDSSPAQRAILSCDHFALLFTAILRLHARPVRSRCGYATYLVSDAFTPHWICEVGDLDGGAWQQVDPEQGQLELSSGAFVPAGRVWLDVTQGRIDPARVLPDYRSGLDGVKVRLLNDANALMKNELLNYDWMIREAAPKAPRLFSRPVADLDVGERALLDELAAATLDVDNQWERLCRLYADYIAAENLRARLP